MSTPLPPHLKTRFRIYGRVLPNTESRVWVSLSTAIVVTTVTSTRWIAGKKQNYFWASLQQRSGDDKRRAGVTASIVSHGSIQAFRGALDTAQLWTRNIVTSFTIYKSKNCVTVSAVDYFFILI